MSYCYRVFPIVCSLLVSACQDNATESTGTAGSDGISTPNSSPLDGSWQARCRQVVMHSEYEQISLQIRDSRHTTRVSYFADAECQLLLRRVQLDGRYESDTAQAVALTSAVSGSNRLLPIFMTLESIALSLFTTQELAAANAADICGIAQWRHGVSFDVSDCSQAQSQTPLPLEIFDSALVDDERLYTATPVAAHAAYRPQQLDTNDYLLRQRTD